ncbi:MAG: hypothetical protein Q7W45_07790 [Bacteroidota bacterium]|nr:hypothetical protein [Bacteroidota bacterium]MDP3144043.1 hypothetical protein [Bacteroidota bacterium]
MKKLKNIALIITGRFSGVSKKFVIGYRISKNSSENSKNKPDQKIVSWG